MIDRRMQNDWYEFTFGSLSGDLVSRTARRYKPHIAEVLKRERTLRITHTCPGVWGGVGVTDREVGHIR